MKCLLLACVFSLSSCEAVMEVIGNDPLEDVRMSRHDAAAMAAGLAAANATPDLDGDADINGWKEWYAWIKTLVQTAKAAAAEAEKK